MLKKILVISIISPDKEGRLKKTIGLLIRKFHVILLCPKCNLEFTNCTHIPIGERRPIGIIEQIRFINELLKTVKTVTRNYDYIDALYVANVLSVPGALILLRKLHISNIIYDAYELFFAMKGKKNGIKNWVYYRFEKAIVYKASLIVEANYERALLVQGFYQLAQLPIVISNFNYMLSNNCIIERKKINTDHVVLGYVGYISKERKLSDLITEVSQNQSIELHIYGSGNDRNELCRMTEELNQKNIFFHEEYTISELETILSSIDIGYINYPYHNYNNIYCEPNKIYEYAANGVPMVSYRHPKLERIFRSDGIGYADDSIVHAVNTIVKNYHEYVDACITYYLHEKESSHREDQEYLTSIEAII